MKQRALSRPDVPPPVPGNGSIDRATLELLANWRTQDATTDPAQIRAAEQELAEFKQRMNENRAALGELLLFP